MVLYPKWRGRQTRQENPFVRPVRPRVTRPSPCVSARRGIDLLWLSGGLRTAKVSREFRPTGPPGSFLVHLAGGRSLAAHAPVTPGPRPPTWQRNRPAAGRTTNHRYYYWKRWRCQIARADHTGDASNALLIKGLRFAAGLAPFHRCAEHRPTTCRKRCAGHVMPPLFCLRPYDPWLQCLRLLSVKILSLRSKRISDKANRAARRASRPCRGIASTSGTSRCPRAG